MANPIYQVDSFTDKPFLGNPAAVCILSDPGEENWMQNVAREMNLSETAFLSPHGEGYNLRWFTPTIEVDLCGHATLAAAHILWEQGYLKQDAVARFYTKSGILAAKKDGPSIVLDFPAEAPAKTDIPDYIIKALDVSAIYMGKNRLDYIIEVDSAETVLQLAPDFSQLRDMGLRGVMVTSRDYSGKYDFISRYFAPGAGIDEDPVTGSAHCCLGPYWMSKLNKNRLRAYQASARGGSVLVEISGDRVYLGGRAVTVMKGELLG
ncbi:MAG: PhzF family phenazine biosynthesis protein [Bacillota bacterium]|nr:PhzF family phenazine biosynthesis protein [Bacillota bacterium]MDW7684801.1 PhzF family phenazine biosynthesis protein [Bacillota bacterium]